MQVISHRGYWKTPAEKNQIEAFERSFSLGLGTETDIRDYREALVISHDIANPCSVSFDQFAFSYNSYTVSSPLALNIKSDGLQLQLKDALSRYNISNYFVFDMSVPDTLGYIKNKIRFFSRQSEYEPEPVFYQQCAGIWLDAFTGDWYSNDIILEHLANQKQVAIVSPELHKREPHSLWHQLKQQNIHLLRDVILCTDTPEEAIEFFKY
jgi:hypothetical protein